MADPLDRFRVGPSAPPVSEQAPVAPDADPLARFQINNSTPPINEADTGLNQEFGLGMSRGGRSFAAMFGGLTAMVGRASEIESLEQAGMNFAMEQQDKAGSTLLEGEVERFSEIEDAGGFFKWAAASMGEAVPSLASAMSGGGLGAVAGKKLMENRLKSVLAGRVRRNLMKKGATTEEASAAARRIISSDDGQRWLAESVFRGKSSQELTKEAIRSGSTKGLIGVSSAPQVGGIDLELQSAGIDAPLTALIGGIAGGALEALPVIKFMDKLFPGVDKQLSKQFVKDFAVATGQQHVLEGGTEALQEVIQLAAMAYHDPSFDPWSPEARTRVLDAYAAGALVGTVMGAAGEAGGQLNLAVREGAVKAPTIPQVPAFEFRPRTQGETFPEGFEPADNTVFQEIRNRVYSTIGPQVEAAVNSAKAKVDPIIEAINVEMNPGMNGEGVRLFDVVSDAHNSFIEQHKDMFDQMHGWLDQQSKRIYEAAAAIRDPEQRQQYIDEQTELVRQKSAAFVDRIRRRAAARDQDVEAEVDNMEFDDNLDVVDEESGLEGAREAPGPEPGDVEAPVAYTFGKNQKRPQVAVSGREEVQGYDSEEQAELGIQTLLDELPETTRDDWIVRQQDDGTYVAEIQNPDLVREDLAFNEILRKSNRNAQKKKRTGNFQVEEESWLGKLRGFKKPTFNLDTLAWEGFALLDKNETRGTLWQAFQASISKMLDRGMIDGDTAQQMLDAYYEQNKEAITDPTPEVYAPVTEYPTRNGAVAGMLKVRDAIRNQFDLEWGWPKGMVDVRENSDGTFSWGIVPGFGQAQFRRLRKKDPEQAAAVLKAIKAERRAEKLASRPIGPGGRDTGVSSDVRGTFAGDPDVEVLGTENIGGVESKITRETPESVQETDQRTNPDNLQSEFAVEDVIDDTKSRRTRTADRTRNQQTGPRGKGRLGPQTESDKRILNRIKRPGKVKALIGMEFDKDGSMTKAIGDLARFVQKTLGLKNEIVVMDDVGLKLAIEMGMVTDPVFKQTLEDPNTHARNIRIGDRSYVYLSNRVLSDPSLSTLALGHELGHQLYSVAWDNLTPQAQANLRKASKTETDEQFNEWMADQLAAWIVNKRLPRNAVEKFFFTVGSKIRQLYDYLKGNKRFELNQTFSDFADAVAERATRAESPGANPLSDARMKQWFKNEGVTMYKWFGKPKKDDMHLPYDRRQVTAETQKAMDSVKQNYPAIAKRAATVRNWVSSAYNNLLAPSTSVLRSLGKTVPVANEIANIFHRTAHGKAKKGSNYHQRVYLMQGQFNSQFDKVRNATREAIKKKEPSLKGKALETAVNLRMRELAESLRKKEGNKNAEFTPLEQRVRTLFDDMHAYARKSGLPVGKINNYFPRQFDRQKLINSRDKIISHLIDDRQMSLHEARRFYESLIDPTALDGRATVDAVETPSYKNMNSRTAQDKFFDQFLDNNLDGIMANYVNAVVKRAEFNRFFGEPMPPTDIDVKEAIRTGLWDPKGQYHRFLRQARRENATDEQIQQIEKYIDANLGQLGRDDISPGLRKWMAGVIAYQNMRVLLFTVFASFPDMVGPAIRANDMGLAWKSMKNNIHEIIKDDSDLAEAARTLGVISDAMNQHIVTEYVDNHYMHPTLRKMNDNFFKYTGLNWYTDFTRKAALAVGMDYIVQMHENLSSKDEKTRLRAEAALKEFGLTKKDVRKWIAEGKPTHLSVNEARHEKVAEALVQFVDESIMRPNPAQRPIMASHPGAMLFYHLKGYLYAVSDVVVGRIAHNVQQAQSPQQTLAALAPALAMMALTAVGLELRELFQFAGSNRTPRTDRMDSWEYMVELVERSGLTGYAQLAIDFEGLDDRGMSEVAGMGGPAMSQLGDWLKRPATQNIPKAIPVIGQLQGGRDAVRTLL